MHPAHRTVLRGFWIFWKFEIFTSAAGAGGGGAGPEELKIHRNDWERE